MQRNLDVESLEVEVWTTPSKEVWAMKALEVEKALWTFASQRFAWYSELLGIGKFVR